jgi:hypothetical protein
MKAIISTILYLLCAATSFAAGGAQVTGDLTVTGGGLFHLNGSSLDTLNGLVKDKGTWSSGVTYSAGDIVQYLGSSYVATTSSLAQTPPNLTFWAVLASQGPKGDTGLTGLQGAPGASGVAVSLFDNSNVMIGKVLSADAYGLTVLTSTNYIISLYWDGFYVDKQILFTSGGCAGVAYLYDDGLSRNTIFGNTAYWVAMKNSFMVPATSIKNTTQSVTMLPASLSTGLDCLQVLDGTSQTGWHLTTITNTALGLPSSIVTPLRLQ